MKKIALILLFALSVFIANATTWVITFSAFGVNGQVGNPACSTEDISYGGGFRVVNELDDTQNHPDGSLIKWYKNSGGCSGTIQFTGHPYFMSGSLPTSTTTYYAKLPDGQCLSYTLVIYNPVGAAGAITGSTSVCKGQTSVTYSVPTITNATSYTWTKPTGVTGTSTTNSITLNYGTSAVSGNITVKGYNICGYGTVSTLAVTVNPLPATPSITPSGSISICQGNSVTLNAPAGFSYLWSNSATTQSINVNTAGNFTVQVIDGNSCTSAASVPITVTVNSLPTTPTINPNGSTTICQGNSVTLNAPAGYSYLWSNSATTQSINASSAGDYTVQVIDANNCTSASSAPITVLVNSLPATPTITPNGATTFCVGGSVTLTAPNGFTYLWSTNETSQDINVTTTGNYTLQIIDGNSCYSLSSVPIIVTVNQPPTPTITPNGATIFCQGDSIVLNAPVGYSYLWSNSSITQSITVNTSGAYTVQVTDGNNCTSLSSNAINVTVNSLPSTPTISAGGATTFCEGNNVVLSAPTGYSSYNWSNGLHTQSITVSTSGNYTVQVVDNNNCISNNSIPVSVTANSLPATPVITANGSTSICQGENVVLSAPAGYNYLWSNSATTQNITVSLNGTYSVRVIDGNSCQSLPSNSITVTINSIPPTPTITQNGHTLTSNATTGNQWYNSTGVISGAISQSYTAITDDNYYVIVTVNGCSSNQSNTINVIGTDIKNVNSINSEIEIYPNPVTNELNIVTKNSNSKLKFEIFNSIGQLVYTSEFAQKINMNISNFANGIYEIKIHDGQNIISKKIIKE